jgi:hypothetical protein
MTLTMLTNYSVITLISWLCLQTALHQVLRQTKRKASNVPRCQVLLKDLAQLTLLANQRINIVLRAWSPRVGRLNLKLLLQTVACPNKPHHHSHYRMFQSANHQDKWALQLTHLLISTRRKLNLGGCLLRNKIKHLKSLHLCLEFMQEVKKLQNPKTWNSLTHTNWKVNKPRRPRSVW